MQVAGARDRGLCAEDLAEATVWVDASADEQFSRYLAERDPAGGESRDVTWKRKMLASWQREPVY